MNEHKKIFRKLLKEALSDTALVDRALEICAKKTGKGDTFCQLLRRDIVDQLVRISDFIEDVSLDDVEYIKRIIGLIKRNNPEESQDIEKYEKIIAKLIGISGGPIEKEAPYETDIDFSQFTDSDFEDNLDESLCDLKEVFSKYKLS